MRVFLDANVIFSACNPGSSLSQLIKILVSNKFAVTSDFAMEEASRNISLKRSSWLIEFAGLTGGMEIHPSVIFPLPIELDEKDQPILCTAIRAHCDYLATGDRRHFGHLFGTSVLDVKIISVSQLAELIVNDLAE